MDGTKLEQMIEIVRRINALDEQHAIKRAELVTELERLSGQPKPARPSKAAHKNGKLTDGYKAPGKVSKTAKKSGKRRPSWRACKDCGLPVRYPGRHAPTCDIAAVDVVYKYVKAHGPITVNKLVYGIREAGGAIAAARANACLDVLKRQGKVTVVTFETSDKKGAKWTRTGYEVKKG